MSAIMSQLTPELIFGYIFVADAMGLT